jgi:PERQ amino acid-rich with GYF domain-containing protein
MLDMYRTQGNATKSLADVLTEGWSPGTIGTSSNGGWSRRDEQKDHTGPEICWDHDGTVQPLGLIDMTEEEKEVRYRYHLDNRTALTHA